MKKRFKRVKNKETEYHFERFAVKLLQINIFIFTLMQRPSAGESKAYGTFRTFDSVDR